MTDNNVSTGGGWSEGEKLKVLWSILAYTKLDWDKIYMPSGRTKNAVMKMLTREKEKARKEINLFTSETGEGNDASPSPDKNKRLKIKFNDPDNKTPKKGTPKKRKGAVAAEDVDNASAESTPSKKVKLELVLAKIGEFSMILKAGLDSIGQVQGLILKAVRMSDLVA